MNAHDLARRLFAGAVTLAIPVAGVAGPLGGTAVAAPAAKAAPPQISASVGASGVTTSQTAVTFSWTDATAGAAFTCSLDGARWATCTSPTTQTVHDGSHSFVVRASTNGHRWSSSTYRWTVDTVPPAVPQLSGQPTAPTSSKSVNISVYDTGVDHYDCTVGTGAGSTACSVVNDAVALNNLVDGTYTLSVRAYDLAGNVSAPGSVSWTIDSTAPNSPTIDARPLPVTNETSGTITFHDDDPSYTAFSCNLDGTVTDPCPTSFPFSGLSEGDHTFTVTARDAAGNTSLPTTARWTVDLTPPAAPQITTAPANPTDQTTAVVQYADTDAGVVSVVCVLNGVSSPCNGGTATFAGLTDHTTYTLVVTAYDAAGNPASSAPVTWTVDTTATGPAQFISGPSSPSNDLTPTFTFDVGATTAATPTGFVCALDPADPSSLGAYTTDCSAGADTGYQLPAGALAATSGTMHDFYVRANYGSGVMSAPTGYHWLLDTVAPSAPSLTGAPASTTTDTAATFAFTSDADATNTCSLDGATAAECTSPITYSGLGAGSHRFVVTSADFAGNSASTSYDWTVSAPAPAAPSGSAPAPATSGTQAAQPATQPASSQSDTTAPAVSLVAPSLTLTGPTTMTFSEPVTGLASGAARIVVTGTTNAVATTVTCLDGTSVVPCTGTFTAVRLTPVKPLTLGQRYSVVVDAAATRDAAGNASVASSTPFRAATSVDENNAVVNAAWSVVKNKGAYGGSLVREHLAGATASWTFTGTAVTWWTASGPDQGKADVLVDGVRKATVNNYAAKGRLHVARVVKGLKKGKHTITVKVRGAKGAKAATGTFVSIDAFTVGKTRTATPTLVSTLRSLASSRFAAGHAWTGDLTGESVTVAFRGTSVTWRAMRSVTQGKAAVYVDGVRKATTDDYAAKTSYGVKHTIGKLADKVHTLRIVILGRHHKGGKGNLVTIDRITVA